MPERQKPRFYTYEARLGRMNRRRDRIVAEIARNRRGGHSVPTWVLGVLLAVLVAALTALALHPA